MRTRTHTYSSTRLDLGTQLDYDLELEHKPDYDDDILAHIEGNKSVIAYLVLDEGGHENPITNGYANGVFVTKSPYMARDMIITDDDYAYRRALCLDSYDQPDVDHRFRLDGESVTLFDLAVREMMRRLKADEGSIREEWCAHKYGELVEGQEYEVDYNEVKHAMLDGDFYSDEVTSLAMQLYKQHWRHVVGDVIPVHYHSERGSTSISLDDNWDGDWEDTMPRGVWIADKDVLDNFCVYADGIKISQVFDEETKKYTDQYGVEYRGLLCKVGTLGDCIAYADANYPTTFEDRRRCLVKYAEPVLQEYADWCDGNIFGCVVETFELGEEEATRVSEDSCWGYIGRDYALETLKTEFFEPAVKALSEEAA